MSWPSKMFEWICQELRSKSVPLKDADRFGLVSNTFNRIVRLLPKTPCSSIQKQFIEAFAHNMTKNGFECITIAERARDTGIFLTKNIFQALNDEGIKTVLCKMSANFGKFTTNNELKSGKLTTKLLQKGFVVTFALFSWYYQNDANIIFYEKKNSSEFERD